MNLLHKGSRDAAVTYSCSLYPTMRSSWALSSSCESSIDNRFLVNERLPVQPQCIAHGRPACALQQRIEPTGSSNQRAIPMRSIVPRLGPDPSFLSPPPL